MSKFAISAVHPVYARRQVHDRCHHQNTREIVGNHPSSSPVCFRPRPVGRHPASEGTAEPTDGSARRRPHLSSFSALNRLDIRPEVRPEISMELSESIDQKHIHGHPNGPAPIGVAPKETARCFAGGIGNFKPQPTVFQAIRRSLMDLRQRANSELREKLRLVKHPAQQSLQPMAAKQRQKMSLAVTRFHPTGNQFAS